MNLPTTKRDWFLWVILQYHGKPYLWAGDDSFGFDCSGLVIEGLKSVGLFPRKSDTTADGLWKKFRPYKLLLDGASEDAGDLCFWFNPQGQAKHIGVCVDEEHYIAAEGGGSYVKTIEDAIKHNAFIKIRPLESRPGARFVRLW